MVNLTLPCGGQCGAVHIGKAAVHIPFEIADGAGIQHRLQLCPDAVHNLRAGEIQRILAADGNGFAVGYLQRPVGVRAVKITVGADGLRLDPKAEIKPNIVDLFA